MQHILLNPPENNSMVSFFIFMNNAIRKTNQLLRDQQKYEFSLFGIRPDKHIYQYLRLKFSDCPRFKQQIKKIHIFATTFLMRSGQQSIWD